MFIATHIENYLPPDQRTRWNKAMANLKDIEARDRADPFVFHGTSSLMAAHILRDGFNPSYLRTVSEDLIGKVKPPWPTPANGVHWGTVNIAAWAVNKCVREDDRPVILYARASDVTASGIAVPDWMAVEQTMTAPFDGLDDSHWDEETPHDADWRATLEKAGAFGVIGGRHVANLQVFDPLMDMPVHPHWRRARESRLETSEKWLSRSVLPPPGHVEPTPETHPPTWSEREADVAVWGEEFVLQGEARRELEAREAEETLAPAM